VSDALALSYGQQLASLVAMMADKWQWPSPEGGFALHTFAAASAELPFAVVDTGLSKAHRRRLVEGPILATAGYLLAMGSADQELQTDWALGLARLTSRQPFPRDRESFFYRPLELLGICLGLGASSEVDPSHRRWLQDVLQQGFDHLKEANLWTQLLGACAAYAAGVTWRERRSAGLRSSRSSSGCTSRIRACWKQRDWTGVIGNARRLCYSGRHLTHCRSLTRAALPLCTLRSVS
jgi:hypothetical protein